MTADAQFEMAPIRVLICDDSRADATLLAYWLGEDPEIIIVGTASSGRQALELTATVVPDVIVLDHMMHDVPDASTELAPALREIAADAAIVLVSSLPDAALAEQAEAIGAEGHASKASAADNVRSVVLRAGRQPRCSPGCPVR